MKKLIENVYKAQLAAQMIIMSIAFIMFLFACKKETPQPELCNCAKVKFAITYAGHKIEDSREPTVQTDCSNDGVVISNTPTNNVNMAVESWQIEWVCD
jgi:hypothetical protein